MAVKLVFRVHAIERMFQRNISVQDVRGVLETGETIERYPDDWPFPSRLVLGWRHNRPIHVIVADDEKGGEAVVVTVYEPDPQLWDADFKRRKP